MTSTLKVQLLNQPWMETYYKKNLNYMKYAKPSIIDGGSDFQNYSAGYKTKQKKNVCLKRWRNSQSKVNLPKI